MQIKLDPKTLGELFYLFDKVEKCYGYLKSNPFMNGVMTLAWKKKAIARQLSKTMCCFIRLMKRLRRLSFIAFFMAHRTM